MIARLIFALLFSIQINCFGQTAQDALSLLFFSFEAKDAQSELIKSLDKLKDDDKFIANKLNSEYQSFILRTYGMEGLFYLYSLMSDQDKKTANKFMAAKSNSYIIQNGESLKILTELKSDSKLIDRNIENLINYIKSSTAKVKQFKYE